jgi:HEAT repeat protein
MADHVRIALEDEGLPAAIVGLFQRLFSNAILDGLRHHDEQVQREWAERDRSLDRWTDEIAAGDFDAPAERAVEALEAAGARALPHLVKLVYDEDRTYADYSVWTALEALARIPSQRSLSVLVGALLDDDDQVAIEIPSLLAAMPDLACPYVDYALTVPGGPDEWTTMMAHEVLVKARCPGAFERLVEGLSYQGESPDDAEGVQVGASFGLLELGDELAIPVLRSWLQDPKANELARYELLREITRSPDDCPWAKEVAGDLTLDTLP